MKVNWINYKYDNGDFAILTVKKSSSWQKWDLNAYLKSGGLINDKDKLTHFDKS